MVCMRIYMTNTILYSVVVVWFCQRVSFDFLVFFMTDQL